LPPPFDVRESSQASGRGFRGSGTGGPRGHALPPQNFFLWGGSLPHKKITYPFWLARKPVYEN